MNLLQAPIYWNTIKALLIFSLLKSSLAWSINIEDDLQAHHFEQTPTRIVALNWSMAENLIELGITPVGIADMAGYQSWVVKPAIPAGVTDVGTRSEPNLEIIQELKPDLILLSSMQLDMLPRLQNIAPTLFYDSFNAKQDNYLKSREIYLSLATLLNKQDYAQQRLQHLEQQLEQLAAQLQQHFSGQLPEVTTIRFNNPATVIVYGDNSMSQAAAKRLGLNPALPQKASQWGITQKKITDLAKIKDGIVVNIEPFVFAEQLNNSPLWQAMPFVKKGHYTTMQSAWSYGGVHSVLYLAQALTTSLLTIESHD
jgi:iron complex transport system substrate-binding protein